MRPLLKISPAFCLVAGFALAPLASGSATPGGVLPIRSRTPGAVNPKVTPGDIRSTICVVGWTETVRPPESYTETLKRRQLASGYTYRGDRRLGDYEEDHLIPLELGGAPRSVHNLWPEPYHALDGARVKDRLENALHRLVCDGRVPLRTAQHAVAVDWLAAYRRYLGRPPTAPTTTTTTVPGAGGRLSCRASVSNAHPADGSTVWVNVATGVAGSSVRATAHYKTTDTTHGATARSDGVAHIPFDIGRATPGHTVPVDLSVTRGQQSASCRTSFTPR